MLSTREDDHGQDAHDLLRPREPDERAGGQRLHRGLGAHRADDAAAQGPSSPSPRTGTCPGRGDRDAAPAHHPRLRRLSARRCTRSSTRRPGSPELAARVQAVLAPAAGRRSTSSGGSTTGRGRCCATCSPTPTCRWSSCRWTRRSPRRSTTSSAGGCQPLREEGVLVIGSGNLVHNLHAYAWGRHPAEPFDWALRFERRARELIARRRPRAARRATSASAATRCSPPPPPTTTCRCSTSSARRHPEDVATFPVEGIDGGSVSMLSVELSAGGCGLVPRLDTPVARAL